MIIYDMIYNGPPSSRGNGMHGGRFCAAFASMFD